MAASSEIRMAAYWVLLRESNSADWLVQEKAWRRVDEKGGWLAG